MLARRRAERQRAMTAKPFERGARLGGHEILELIGAGGMGTVYRARQLESGTEVAVKVMLPGAALDDINRRRFVREARATMALSHPHVLRILGTFEHEGLPAIVMELLRGSSLKDYLRKQGKLGLAEAAAIFVRVVSAVGAAHALGLVHRDLKPDNVFLSTEPPFVKVLDFGIAKLQTGGALDSSGALTATGAMIGTPYYMSPEQAFGEKDLDHRADLWSLGMMLYEMLTGTLLTRADEYEQVFRHMLWTKFPLLHEVDPALPKDVSKLVARMLERDRDARPADLREVFEVMSPYAPEIENDVVRFDAASPPLRFEDATTGSGVRRLEARAAAESARDPLKLAPSAIKAPVPIGGTLVMSEEARRSKPASPLPAALPAKATLAATASDAPPREALARVATLPPAAPSRSWMWMVAALLVLGSVALLWWQLA